MNGEINKSPKDFFRGFLEKAEEDGWIASYKWCSSDSFMLLRDKLGGPNKNPLISRSHKKGTDGMWWALEVEAHEGTMVGVDLEILMERPLFTNPTWIINRLGINRNATTKSILEEWSYRESAFKAMAPENNGIRLNQFRRNTPNSYNILIPQGERSIQVRNNWGAKWLISLAWRSLN